MHKASDASAALRDGTLTDVYEALNALRKDPGQITDQLAAELVDFLLKALRRIYRTWSGKANDEWIRLGWGGFSDSIDDEALFDKTAKVLALIMPDLDEIMNEYKSPIILTAGGRLSRRKANVLPMLRNVVQRLSTASHPRLAAGAKNLLDDIDRDAV